MFPPSKLLTAAVTTLLLFALLLTSRAQDPNSDKIPYVRTGQEASFSGTVTFTGKPPKPRKIDMSADSACYEGHPKAETEWYVVTNGRLANVLVFVTGDGILENFFFEPPGTAVVLEHKGCRYEPRVLGIQVAQPLLVINSDNTHHNTHPYPKLNTEWNQTQSPGAAPLSKTFPHAELVIPFKDNQHPWEQAYVSVFKHPFFAVTDKKGNLRLKGSRPARTRLPPGTNGWGRNRFRLSLQVVSLAR